MEKDLLMVTDPKKSLEGARSAYNIEEEEQEQLRLFLENKAVVEKAYIPLLRKFQDDLQIYVGNQFSAAQEQELYDNGRIPMVINHTKKACDVVEGHFIQNMSNLKCFPIQGADMADADIYTQGIKWMMTNRDGEYAYGRSIGSAVRTGLGWLNVEMDNSDSTAPMPYIGEESIFRVLPDPYFTKVDLSDLEYLFRRAYLPKKKAVSSYPDSKEIIENLRDVDENDPLWSVMKPQFGAERKGFVAITEMWYRSYEESYLAINPETLQPEEVDKDTAELWGDYIPNSKSVIKLMIVADDVRVLYDGPNPFDSQYFPFIPMIYMFIPEMPTWPDKIQGLIRLLKDSQVELNKRRAQELATVLSMPFSATVYEEDSIEDETVLSKQSGPGKMIKYKKGSQPPNFITPAQSPLPLHELARMHVQDMRELGPTAEMLGIRQGGSEAGITVNLRKQQNVTALEPIDANFRKAYRHLGTILIDYMKNMDLGLLQSIVDVEIPPEFEEKRKTARFDCIVDTVPATPSARMAMNMQLMEFVQKLPLQMLPPPITLALFEAILQTIDLPSGAQLMLMQAFNQFKAQQQAPPPPPEGMPPESGPPPM